MGKESPSPRPKNNPFCAVPRGEVFRLHLDGFNQFPYLTILKNCAIIYKIPRRDYGNDHSF